LGAEGKKKQRKKKYQHFIQQLFGEEGFSFTKKNEKFWVFLIVNSQNLENFAKLWKLKKLD
jgi:hypothetical protein